MIEYRIIKLDNSALHEMWRNNWQLICINEWMMYFSKQVKQSREQKKAIQTPEYLEFRKAYPSSTGIYDDKLIKKYNDLVNEWLHKDIINAVEQYKKELAVTWQAKIANASTFLNQKRWLQNFRVVKDVNEEWVNDMLKWLDALIITQVLETKKQWEKNNPTKKCTPWILANIIEKYRK